MKDFDPANVRVVGFDADDTLWVNEPFYRETERKFSGLLAEYASPEEINRQLYEVETGNLSLYGYGCKAFTLSLIETALLVSGGRVTPVQIGSILELGKSQIVEKNPLLPGVHEVLGVLARHYRLIVATKGDLLDQERKLRNSGIAGYFHHIEIMSDKKEEHYRKLLDHMDIRPGQFLMVGNSIRSDVLPVVRLGGYAVHIPYAVTWLHEELSPEEMPDRHFVTISQLPEVLKILAIPESY